MGDRLSLATAKLWDPVIHISPRYQYCKLCIFQIWRFYRSKFTILVRYRYCLYSVLTTRATRAGMNENSGTCAHIWLLNLLFIIFRYGLPRFAYGVDGMLVRFDGAPRDIPAGNVLQEYWCRKQFWAINCQVTVNLTFTGSELPYLQVPIFGYFFTLLPFFPLVPVLV